MRQLTTAEKTIGKKTLPPLARYAMVDVLHDLGIKVALADQEADGVVAAMARANGCCAVSKDSDLFVMDLPAGYIPVDNLDIARNGSVTAKRFNRAKFCAEMGIHAGMLPLLASAVGNDYVSQGLLRPFHASLGDEEPKMPACWQTDGKEASVRDLLIVRVAAFLVKQPSQEAVRPTPHAPCPIEQVLRPVPRAPQRLLNRPLLGFPGAPRGSRVSQTRDRRAADARARG